MAPPPVLYYQGGTIVRYVASKAMFNHKKFKQRKYDYFFPIHVIHVTVLAEIPGNFLMLMSGKNGGLYGVGRSV
jgi:hypothetical protein